MKSFNFIIQELVGEFEVLGDQLDLLRVKGADIVRSSNDPDEEESINKTLSDLNRQWDELQGQSIKKSQELKTAEELTIAFEEATVQLQNWCDQAEVAVISEPVLTDFERVKEQLHQHRVSS